MAMEVTAAATVTATAMAVVTTHITVVMAMVTVVITGITVVITEATVTVTTESTTTIAAVIKAPPPLLRKPPQQPQPLLTPKLLQLRLPQTLLPLASPINLVVQEVVAVMVASSSGTPLAVKVRVSLLRIITLVPVQQTTMKSLLSLRNHRRTRFCSTAATPVMVVAVEELLLQVAVVAGSVEVATPTIDL